MNSNNEVFFKEIFTKNELLEIEIASVVEHILAWNHYQDWKTCWWSQLRYTVYSWMKWELWERFRLLKCFQNQDILKEFAEMISKM